jgi:hypothetical protein
MRQKGLWNGLLCLGLFVSAFPAWGITPMEYYNTLVAGGDDAGYRDGNFTQARFGRPSGLAFDTDGKRLFVADRDNNRIRVIYLNEENRVETLAGMGQAGQVDGPLDKATFNQPTALAWIPPDHLAVYDMGTQSIRLVDLASKAVTTLKGEYEDGKVGWIWNLVYRQQDDCLYLTQTYEQTMLKWDFKARKWGIVFHQDPKVPHPMALCLEGKDLFVADKDLPTVYRVDQPEPTSTPTVSVAAAGKGTTPTPTATQAAPGTVPTDAVTLTQVGNGDHILELAATDGIVYALQAGAIPLARVIPEYKPVSLTSAWRFFLTNDNEGMDPFLAPMPSEPIGFGTSPTEKRKFYVAQPNKNVQSIVSVTDYDFGNRWLARAMTDQIDKLTDFDYPKEKPPGTFRILITGGSRAVMAPIVDADGKNAGEGSEYKTQTFPKQLEFLLNAQAALQGSGIRFEVLTVGHPGLAVQHFAYYEVPPIAKAYDVDLVLLFLTPFCEDSFSEYFNNPITGEGIPAHEVDPEYLLKPISQRLKSDVARRFYELCEKKKWVNHVSPSAINFTNFGEMLNSGDPEARTDLLEMMGKSLGFLSSKLRDLKTNEGVPVKYFACFAPSGDQGAAKVADYVSFWKDICVQDQWPWMDLTDAFNAFQYSYFPTNQSCCHRHYTAYGNDLMANLLNFYLVQDKWIPAPQPTSVGANQSK